MKSSILKPIRLVTNMFERKDKTQLYGECLHHVTFIFTQREEIRQGYDLLNREEKPAISQFLRGSLVRPQK